MSVVLPTASGSRESHSILIWPVWAHAWIARRRFQQ
jgi:hypothetical protein